MWRLVSYLLLTLLFTLCADRVDYVFDIVVIKELLLLLQHLRLHRRLHRSRRLYRLRHCKMQWSYSNNDVASNSDVAALRRCIAQIESAEGAIVAEELAAKPPVWKKRRSHRMRCVAATWRSVNRPFTRTQWRIKMTNKRNNSNELCKTDIWEYELFSKNSTSGGMTSRDVSRRSAMSCTGHALLDVNRRREDVDLESLTRTPEDVVGTSSEDVRNGATVRLSVTITCSRTSFFSRVA